MKASLGDAWGCRTLSHVSLGRSQLRVPYVPVVYGSPHRVKVERGAKKRNGAVRGRREERGWGNGP